MARTDEQGRFRVVVATLQTMEVRVQAEGLAPKVVASAQPGQHLEVRLEKGRVLEGLVRDASSGKPVSGAAVQAWTGGQPRTALQEEPSEQKTSTDARGAFRLDGLGLAPVTVTVTSPGYAVLHRRARVGTRLDLLLLRGLSIAGSVRDPKGQPIEGATVQAEADLVSDPLPATTNAEGRFAIVGVDDRPYRVWARRGEGGTSLIEEVTVAADTDAHLDLVIPRSCDIVGRLVSGGPKPVPGTVGLTELDGSPSHILLSLLRSAAGADGRFRISGVPPGSHTLGVTAPGFGPRRLDVVVEAGAPLDLGDVELDRGLAIRGRVQDASAAPVAGARIRGHPSGGGASTPEALSETDGSFTLAGLEEGAYTLIVSSAGYGEARREVPTGAQNAVITLRRGGSVSGQVVDDGGKPVEVFSVSVRETHREHDLQVFKAPTSVEDAGGRFTVDDLPEGTYAVEVFAEGKRPGSANDVAVTPRARADVGRIRLEAGGTVRGVVVDGRGSPIASARVAARGPGFSQYATDAETTSDLDGGFELRGTPLGAVEVHASHPDFATGKTTVTVELDGPATARVVLTSGGRIAGHARRRDGSGIPDAYVCVQSQGMNIRAFRDFLPVAPEEGAFLAEHVPPGSTAVALMLRAGDSFTNQRGKHADVVEGETTRVDFAAPEILVSGRVTRSSEPLAGVRVSVGGGGTMTYSFGSLAAPAVGGLLPGLGITQADGSYALLADEPGRTWVSVESLDRHRKYLERRIEIPDGDSFALDIVIPGASASGVVVDRESGEPLYPASVRAFPASGQAVGADTRPDGQFEIDLDPGRYPFQASAPGHAKQRVDVSVEASGARDLKLALARGGTLEGTVLDAAGRPVPGLQVSASTGEGADYEGLHGFQSLGDGSFVIEGLAERPYNVFAGNELAGFGLVPQVSPGASNVVLSLQPGGRLRTTVRGADGAPAPGAAVRVDRVGGFVVSSSVLGCVTGPDGRCEMATPQGSIRLRVSHAPAQVAVTVQVPAQGLAEVEAALP
jgi:protocatechuate 3,4-dioxygenase beta subunit